MSLIVAGTGTGVGKTFVSSLLLHRYPGLAAYYKPVSTGSEPDTVTVRALAPEGAAILPETYSFAAPMSPHAAQELEGRVLDPARIHAEIARHQAHTSLIIEGIGGVLVPLTAAGLTWADLARTWGLPTLVVASSRLGTINHTLLTLEALRSRGASIAGVVLVGPAFADNRRAIERFGAVTVLGELPELESIDRQSLSTAAHHLDPGGELENLLRVSAVPRAMPQDARRVWRPYTQMKTARPAIPIQRASGAWLETVDGQRVLDGTSSWWVNIHGHGHPRLAAALAQQATELSQVLFADFVHSPAIELANALSAKTGASGSRVFFSDDGSTAVEVAIKVALQSWKNRGVEGRDLIVSLAHGYHGDTFGAMALGQGTVFHAAFSDLLMEVRHVRAACCDADGHGDEGAALPTFAEVLATEAHRVAALIIEPLVQGAGGMKIHPSAAYAELGRLAAEAGIPLISDEIFTGFGRTGTFLAGEQAGLRPEIICLSKGLTGGMMPLGATVVAESLAASFDADDRRKMLFHGHSYTGNALACRVALESLRVFEDEGSLAKVQQIQAWFSEELRQFVGHPAVAETRGIGGLAVIELHSKVGSNYLDPRGPELQTRLLGRGIHLRPLGNVVYFLPPYCITEEEVRWVFRELRSALDG